jgi:hypothetical protein
MFERNKVAINTNEYKYIYIMNASSEVVDRALSDNYMLISIILIRMAK